MKELKAFFGTEDAKQLPGLFCREIQKALIEKEDREEARPVEILQFLFPDSDIKKREPIALFEQYNGQWMTQGYVGAIRLVLKGQGGSGDLDVTVRIRSRFDAAGEPRFLRYVLEKAFDLPSEETKGVVYKDMTVESALGAALDLLLLHLFFRQLRAAMKKGIYRQYQEFAHNDSNVKGRIDIPRHLRENPLSNGKVCYVTREYTVNNAVNQLILKAAECLERKYRSPYRNLLKKREYEQCARGLAALRGELPDAAPVSARQAVRNASKRIAHSIYRDYEPLRKTCIAILRRFGVDSFQAKEQEAAGLLLDMPALWEIFLYNTIFKKIAGNEAPYRQSEELILADRRTVKPDFPPIADKLVLDAKYKRVWADVYKHNPERWDNQTREDVLQIIAYMHIFQCKEGGVIFPVNSGKAHWEATDIKEFELHRNLPEEKFLLIPYFIPGQADAPEAKDFVSIMEKNSARIYQFFKTVTAVCRDPAEEAE